MILLYKNLLIFLIISSTNGQSTAPVERINYNQPPRLLNRSNNFRDEREDNKLINKNPEFVNKNQLNKYIPFKNKENVFLQKQKQLKLNEEPVLKNNYNTIKNYQNNRNLDINHSIKQTSYNVNIDKVPEQPTIYDTAVKYWTKYNCEYPPKDFYEIFKSGCDITFNNLEFTPGLCYAFFNSTTELCSLDLDKESKNTLSSITSIQSTIENDAICDTLVSMQQDYPGLFPVTTGSNAWYKQTSEVIFSDKCKYACGLRGAHPICFGFMLNYDVLSSEYDKSKTTKVPEIQVNQITADFEKHKTEIPEDFINLEDQKNYKFNTNTTNRPYRPNPKLLLNQEFSLSNQNYFSNYYDPYMEENSLIVADGAIMSDAIEEYNNDDEKEKTNNDEDGSEDVVEVAKPLLEEEYLLSFDGKTFDKTFDKLVDQDYNLKLDAAEETINEDREVLEDLKHQLEDEISDINKKLSPFQSNINFSSGEMIFNFILLSLGIVVILLLLMLFKASRRGLRRLRVGRNGRNWNYERVQNINPGENVLYEN